MNHLIQLLIELDNKSPQISDLLESFAVITGQYIQILHLLDHRATRASQTVIFQFKTKNLIQLLGVKRFANLFGKWKPSFIHFTNLLDYLHHLLESYIAFLSKDFLKVNQAPLSSFQKVFFRMAFNLDCYYSLNLRSFICQGYLQIRQSYLKNGLLDLIEFKQSVFPIIEHLIGNRGFLFFFSCRFSLCHSLLSPFL